MFPSLPAVRNIESYTEKSFGKHAVGNNLQKSRVQILQLTFWCRIPIIIIVVKRCFVTGTITQWAL